MWFSCLLVFAKDNCVSEKLKTYEFKKENGEYYMKNFIIFHFHLIFLGLFNEGWDGQNM
jgi:hypothetical protein